MIWTLGLHDCIGLPPSIISNDNINLPSFPIIQWHQTGIERGHWGSEGIITVSKTSSGAWWFIPTADYNSHVYLQKSGYKALHGQLSCPLCTLSQLRPGSVHNHSAEAGQVKCKALQDRPHASYLQSFRAGIFEESSPTLCSSVQADGFLQQRSRGSPRLCGSDDAGSAGNCILLLSLLERTEIGLHNYANNHPC